MGAVLINVDCPN